jgi:hypothetical protein
MMSDSTQILRTAIRIILAEGDVPRTPAVNVSSVRGTYKIPMPKLKSMAKLALGTHLATKAADFFQTGCVTNNFPVINMQALIETYEAQSDDDAKLIEQKTSLEEADKDLDGLTRRGVGVYKIINLIGRTWPASAQKWSDLTDPPQKGAVKRFLKDTVGRRCTFFDAGTTIEKMGGDDLTREVFVAEMQKYLDYLHETFTIAADDLGKITADSDPLRDIKKKEETAYKAAMDACK